MKASLVKQLFLLCILSLILSCIGSTIACADILDSKTTEFVGKVILAGGGEAKLLKLFRIKEQFNFGKEVVSPGTPRVSVVEPPRYWWLGTKERTTEPAKFAVWAWTLGILTDPKSKIELIDDITDNGKSLAGLRVTGSVTPALDMYFDKTILQLDRIDWRNDIYRFSEWKEHEGAKYPSKCVMYRRKSGEPWLYHEIISIERLKELPSGLKRE